jgi:opacity protein-like surface antigen
VFGAGIRYEITPSIFTKLEYNFEFSKKFRIPKDIAATVTGASVKARSHVVKLGVGYRF